MPVSPSRVAAYAALALLPAALACSPSRPEIALPEDAPVRAEHRVILVDRDGDTLHGMEHEIEMMDDDGSASRLYGGGSEHAVAMRMHRDEMRAHRAQMKRHRSGLRVHQMRLRDAADSLRTRVTVRDGVLTAIDDDGETVVIDLDSLVSTSMAQAIRSLEEMDFDFDFDFDFDNQDVEFDFSREEMEVEQLRDQAAALEEAAAELRREADALRREAEAAARDAEAAAREAERED